MTSIEVELVMSLLAMSLGLGLHQQKGQLGQREVVGCTQSMAASGLGYRKALVGTVWAISLFFCMHRIPKIVLWPCGASISDNDAFSQSARVVIGFL